MAKTRPVQGSTAPARAVSAASNRNPHPAPARRPPMAPAARPAAMKPGTEYTIDKNGRTRTVYSPGPGFRVRAFKMGIYRSLRFRPGDVFDLENAKDFNDSWMLRTKRQTPEKVTTAQGALKEHHDQTLNVRIAEKDRRVAAARSRAGQRGAVGDTPDPLADVDDDE